MAGCSFARRPSNAFRRAPARPPRWARRGGPLAWAPALAGALGLGFLAAAPIALARPLGATECSDAIDNDADGFIDLADAGCLADLLRDDETGELVVNSTLDAIDANPGDGLCQTQLMGECTVRAAIMEANASPGKQGVQVPTGTFELTIAPVGASPGSADGDLDIAGDLVLIGAGAENTRIGGTSELSLFSDRIFEILPATQVTISGVTAQYAGAYDGGGIFNAGTLALMNTRVSGNRAYDTGGGIYDVGTLTITNSTISWNYTPYNGGGIFIQSGGTLTLVDSAVSGNSNSYYADGGAGIFSEGTATLTNSTVSGNYALASGGGGIDNRGIMALTNSTVSGNYAKYGGGGIVNTSTLSLMNSSVSGNEAYYVSGDGIFNWGSGQTQLISSLIAANGDENCGCFFGGSPMPCDSFIDSNGHNLSDDTTCFAAVGTDLVVADAMLGPLADNGGPTDTHDLLPGSPAIDTGDDASCPATDQRGEARPFDGDGDGIAHCDIGAVEFVPEPSGWLLLASGAGALVGLRRARRRRSGD